MSECVILIRMPSGIVTAITNEDGENIYVFPDEAGAKHLASTHILCRFRPYQIVELEI